MTACTGSVGDFRVTVAGPDGATREVEAGAIVVATGFSHFDPGRETQVYGYYEFPDVITLPDAEKMLSEHRFVRHSTGEPPRNVAFIQCAGSRDRNHLKHCSRICCMASLKQTTYVREKFGDDADVSIYYIDIRAIDRLEDFYKKIQADPKVKFIKSKVANITQDNATGDPILHGVNTEGYHRYDYRHDLVVLAVGMEPSVDAKSIGAGVAADNSGFIDINATEAAIFGAGCASNALDVNRAVQNATAAALRAIQVVNRVARAEV